METFSYKGKAEVPIYSGFTIFASYDLSWHLDNSFLFYFSHPSNALMIRIVYWEPNNLTQDNTLALKAYN